MQNDDQKLSVICDALSDLILGGESGWREMDFDAFVQLCRLAVAKRNESGLHALHSELDTKKWKGKNEILNHAITNVKKRVTELLCDCPKEEYILKPLLDGFTLVGLNALAPFEDRLITIEGLCDLPIPVVPVEVCDGILYVGQPDDH